MERKIAEREKMLLRKKKNKREKKMSSLTAFEMQSAHDDHSINFLTTTTK